MLQLAFAVVLALLVGAIYLLGKLWGAMRAERREHERVLQELESRIQAATKRSLDQSRFTIKGQLAEQMAPLLPGFPYSAKDARFLGDPIDYIVFDGLTEGPDCQIEIVLVEVKQNQGQLKPIQRAIGAAVEEGRIRFEVCRVSDEFEVSADAWRPRHRNSFSPTENVEEAVVTEHKIGRSK